MTDISNNPKKIKITCDSTCDLTPQMYEKYDIEVLPLGIVVGDELKRDSVDINPPGIFEYVSTTGMLPTTPAACGGEDCERFSKCT